MTTAVSGLIKIGQTGTGNYQERMRNLEANGYYNVSGLKRFFAIELEDFSDKEIIAKVVGEREVEYGEQIWKLAPLTYKIYEQKGKLNNSGAYQGAAYWQYKGKRLRDLPDIN